ncbi:uncharacterized protein LOC141613142 [Silene latifolia]|uniref:uncharacterized protein LOC141613142 n=1 Tax=Silene latifolia TaxID=37657 RepID=UPI003D77397C
MSVQESNDLIERLVGRSRNFGRRVKKASVASSSKQNSNHMEAKVDFLTNLVKELAKGNGSTSHVKFCGLCNDPTHPTDGCPSLQTEEASEAVNAFGFRKFDPYSNTYNEGWKAHPNFGWGVNQNQNQKGPSKSSFQKPNQNQNQSQNSLEDMMKTLAMNQVAMQKENQALQANTKEFQTAMLHQNRLTDSRIGNLETQVGQILNLLTKQPNQGGGLPSHTIPPSTKEQAQAVSLRNGRELEEAPKAPKKSKPLPFVHEVEDVIEDEIEIVVEHGKASTLEQVRVNEPLPEYEPQAPFPSALNDTRVMDKKTSSLYEIFRKVEVNIPLFDLLSSVPKYAKFLKELCTTKRINKDKSMKKVRANGHVSAIFQKRLPQKCGDPDMFTIPCKIGELECQRVMLDLGASINVLPHYLYVSLKLGPLKPTHVIISLADRSNIYPNRIIEDVLVKVGDMIFSADLYMIEMEPEKGSTPILLGRPFMKTSNTKIDVSSGCLTMEFESEKIKYNIYEAMKYPTETSSLCFLEIFEPIVQTFHELSKDDPLDIALTNGMIGEDTGYALSCNLKETIQDL